MCYHVSPGLHVAMFSGAGGREGGREGRREEGKRGGGRQLCSEAQPLTGFYETRPGGCQVIQTSDPFHPAPRLAPELLFLPPVGLLLLNPNDCDGI